MGPLVPGWPTTPAGPRFPLGQKDELVGKPGIWLVVSRFLWWLATEL